MKAWKWLGIVVLAGASAAIFAAYRRPDAVISLSNAFLALCGLK
ncbi:MAG: hypothetical protein AB7K53_10495 [Burkholderiales bacterium]